jgi:hypothetical protein
VYRFAELARTARMRSSSSREATAGSVGTVGVGWLDIGTMGTSRAAGVRADSEGPKNSWISSTLTIRSSRRQSIWS